MNGHYILRTRILQMATVLGLITGMFTVPSVANAQSSATLTANPVAPALWRISGSGFPPNERLRVVEIPCGSLPCGAGTTAATAVTVGADGTFTADVDFSHASLPPGRGFFVVSAFPITRAGLASDPTVLITPSTELAPSAPVTGSGASRTHSHGSAPLLIVGVLVCGLSLLPLALSTRDWQKETPQR